MSKRYEISYAHQASVYVVAPHESHEEDLDDVVYGEGVVKSGQELPETDTHVLVIGNPCASAYGLVGTPEQLRDFRDHLSRVLAEQFPAQ